MHRLELKFPPPLVAAVAALLVYLPAKWLPAFALPSAALPWLAAICAVIGAVVGLSAISLFRRARTTVHPQQPQHTSHLVTGGIYRFTRNPMYLGIAFMLLAWTIWLGNPAGLVGLLFFIAYLTRFQIIPEERILQAKFGADYLHYRQQTRRWL